MTYAEYLESFRAHDATGALDEFARVTERGTTYPLLRFVTPGRRTLVITAGFHGDEPAGPLTLLEYVNEITAFARRRDVGLRIYPLVNPSGFEARTRYNASGESPNNDLIRYEVAPGVWKDQLAPGDPFLRTVTHLGGPQETRALRADLELCPTPVAALDIHQDNYLGEPLTYAYVFGQREAYLPLMERAAEHAPVARSYEVDDAVHTDADGLIVLHDGSVTDYFHRRGVPYTAALETTTENRRSVCHAINLAWIRGFIELAARAETRAATPAPVAA